MQTRPPYGSHFSKHPTSAPSYWFSLSALGQKRCRFCQGFVQRGQFYVISTIKDKIWHSAIKLYEVLSKNIFLHLFRHHSSWIEDSLKVDPLQRGAVSGICEVIKVAATPSVDRIKQQWGAELGLAFPAPTWQKVVGLVHTSSICIRNGLL